MGWWTDRTTRKSSRVLAGLVLLAAMQVGALVVTVRRGGGPVTPRLPDLLMGERFATVPGRDSLARITSLSLRRHRPDWTVLLAFSPTCAWCDSVAPRWKSWTEAAAPRVHVLGVVASEPAPALAYVRVHGWKIQGFVAVDSVLTGDFGRQLTRKTPWFFLFDSAGVLRYSGHGNEIGTVDSIVAQSAAIH